jgi:hypothetical protein
MVGMVSSAIFIPTKDVFILAVGLRTNRRVAQQKNSLIIKDARGQGICIVVHEEWKSFMGYLKLLLGTDIGM